MRLLIAGSLVRVQLGEPKKSRYASAYRLFFHYLLTRTNDKLLQIWRRQIWKKQSSGLFRSRLRNLEVQPKWYTALCAPFFCFIELDSNQRQAAPNLHYCKFGRNSPVKNGGSKPPPYDQYLFHLLTTLFPLYNSPKICIHFYR